MSDSVAHAQTRMSLSRRRLLRGVLATSVLSLAPACGQVGGFAGSGPGAPAGPGQAALLLPLSGHASELGTMLQQAASLGGGPGIGIDIVDSGSTPESAVAAAQSAISAGAKMIVGPLFGAQAQEVARAVPSRVPVVTLSNDDSLAGGNLFVFGVTPAHSAQAILSLAAQRNLRDVAIVVPPGAFGEQSVAAARALAPSLGLALRAPLVRSDAGGLLGALQTGGALPQAVYLPAADASLRSFVEALRGSGIQILGSTQWAALDIGGDRAFRDAWFPAPDPLRFAPFDEAFAEATGRPGGIVAGLTYDGTELLRLLGRQGEQTRKGLLREAGFSGVLGPYRFLKSGLCQRGLAVLRVDAGSFSLIGATSV